MSELGDLVSTPDAKDSWARNVEKTNKFISEKGIRAFAFVVVQGNGEVVDSWHAGNEFYKLVGALEQTKADMIHEARDEDD